MAASTLLQLIRLSLRNVIKDKFAAPGHFLQKRMKGSGLRINPPAGFSRRRILRCGFLANLDILRGGRLTHTGGAHGPTLDR